jgi:hypothetical protein
MKKMKGEHMLLRVVDCPHPQPQQGPTPLPLQVPVHQPRGETLGAWTGHVAWEGPWVSAVTAQQEKGECTLLGFVDCPHPQPQQGPSPLPLQFPVHQPRGEGLSMDRVGGLGVALGASQRHGNMLRCSGMNADMEAFWV